MKAQIARVKDRFIPAIQHAQQLGVPARFDRKKKTLVDGHGRPFYLTDRFELVLDDRRRPMVLVEV